MSVPGIVQETLSGESVTARVSLGGEDEAYVTPTRTIVYRGEGLLRDESIEEYDHDVEQLAFSEGRRKTRISMTYAIDGTEEFTVPSESATELLEPLLGGVLLAMGVLEDDESVQAAYRFSELALIVTDRRLVKHVGEAVFDEEFEEYHFEDVTGLSIEEGSVSTQIVLEVDGHPQRIKTPNERAAEVHMRLENGLMEYHDAASSEALAEEIGIEDPDTGGDTRDGVDFGEGVDPLGADPEPTDAGGDQLADLEEELGGAGNSPRADEGASPGVTSEPNDVSGASTNEHGEPDAGTTAVGGTESGTGTAVDAPADEPTAEEEDLTEAGFEPAESQAPPEIRAELEELREVVERQNQLLAQQQQTIEQLIEELSRGR